MKYIKIYFENQSSPNKEKTFLEKLLSFLLPKANPDFDNDIYKINTWLLEFEDEASIPNREIGLYDNKPHLKMPFKENYGYWTDNNLCLVDFKNQFKWEGISKNLFEENWNSPANVSISLVPF